VTPATLLFDGDCGLCVATAGWLAARVPAADLRMLEVQRVDEAPDVAAAVRGRDLACALHLVGADGGVRVGAAAAIGAARLAPGWGTAARLYDHPLGHALWEPADRLVAGNRRRVGHRLGIADACRI
jgi:predicted DCC family thiol-disulfide oxidoreductase YuxK